MAQQQFDATALLDALQDRPDLDVVHEMVAWLYQALINTEATEVIGAEPHERSITRTTRRNGHRSRTLSSKAGDLELKIPKLRKGSFFPSLLERRRRIDQALYAVVMEAYVHGVSTRKVDDLVQALGIDGGDLQVRGVADLCGAGHRARGLPPATRSTTWGSPTSSATPPT